MNAFSDILMITPLITRFTPKFPQPQLQRDQQFFPPKPGPSFRWISFRLVSPRFASFCLASSFDRIDQELPALETKLTELRQKKAWNHEADRS
jgi:hypothetical protein